MKWWFLISRESAVPIAPPIQVVHLARFAWRTTRIMRVCGLSRGCLANAQLASSAERGVRMDLPQEDQEAQKAQKAQNDQRLHEGLQRGDTQVLAEVLQLNRNRMLRSVRMYGDSRLAKRLCAEDVVQEVYLAAAQRLGHYAQDSFTRPYTWLRAVLQQTLIDLHRRHLGAQARDARREVAQVSPGLDATSRALAKELSGSITTPSGATMRAETNELLIAALDNLAPADREIIALRHFEDLGNGEIADVLGIEEKAASIRYVRAIRRLKLALEAAGLGLSELHAR